MKDVQFNLQTFLYNAILDIFNLACFFIFFNTCTFLNASSITAQTNAFQDTKGNSPLLYFSKPVSMIVNIQQGGITASWKPVPDSTWKNKGDNNIIGGFSLGLLTTNNLINAVTSGEITPGSKISGFLGWRDRDTITKDDEIESKGKMKRRSLPILSFVKPSVFIFYINSSWEYNSNKIFHENAEFDKQIITEKFNQYDISFNTSTITNIGDIGIGFGFRNTNNVENLPTITISDSKLIYYDTTSNTYRFGNESQEVKVGDYRTFNDNLYLNMDYYYPFQCGIGLYLYERNYNSYSDESDSRRLRFNSSGIGLYYIDDPINAEHKVSFGVALETNPYVNFPEIKIKNCLINFIGGLSL